MIPTWKSMGSKSKLQAKGTASGDLFLRSYLYRT